MLLIIEYERRTGEEHRQKAYEWLHLPEPQNRNDTERDDFFRQYGVRWTELAHFLILISCVALSSTPCTIYYLVRSSFNNTFTLSGSADFTLGVVKTQWYGQWIQDKTLRENTEAGRTRELDVLHTFNTEVSTCTMLLGSICELLTECAGF